MVRLGAYTVFTSGISACLREIGIGLEEGIMGGYLDYEMPYGWFWLYRISVFQMFTIVLYPSLHL